MRREPRDFYHLLAVKKKLFLLGKTGPDHALDKLDGKQELCSNRTPLLEIKNVGLPQGLGTLALCSKQSSFGSAEARLQRSSTLSEAQIKA